MKFFFLSSFFFPLFLPRSVVVVFKLLIEMLFSTPLLLILSLVTQGATAHPKPVRDDAQLGAVASESSVCSNIGINILREGGNAADAVSSKLPHSKNANTAKARCDPILRGGDWHVPFWDWWRRLHACAIK